MKPVRTTGLVNSPDAHRYMAEQNAKVLGGNVSFGSGTFPDNIKGTWGSGTTAAGPTTIYHGLGYVPQGYIIVSKSAACDIYDAPGWDGTNIFVQGSVVGVTFNIFVLG